MGDAASVSCISRRWSGRYRSQVEQLTVYPGRSPQWIGDAHPADQIADFGRYRPAARAASRLPAPVSPRNPARCQRSTVSGRTIASASQAPGNSRQAHPNSHLSLAKNGSRVGLPRRNTMICCRSTKTSVSNAARDRNRSTTIPKIILQRSNIPQRIIRFCVCRQLHGIYDRDR